MGAQAQAAAARKAEEEAAAQKKAEKKAKKEKKEKEQPQVEEIQYDDDAMFEDAEDLQVGDEVEVIETFVGDSEDNLECPKGARGVILAFEDDGAAEIEFAELGIVEYAIP